VNTTKDMSFTVSNGGDAGSILNGSATMDLPLTYFTCIAGCGAYAIDTLTPRTVTIRFTPGATPFIGAATQITFTGTNTATPASITGTMFGNGVSPLSGTGLNFGNVIVGKTKTLVLTITNTSGALVSDTLTMPSGLPYTCYNGTTYVTSCPVSIAGNGGTQSITIRFAPTAVQAYNGNASLTTNSTVLFPFTGAGVQGTFRFIEQ
jgi:hypothetical protein